MLKLLSRLFPGRGGPLADATLAEMFRDQLPAQLCVQFPQERADPCFRLWARRRGDAAGLRIAAQHTGRRTSVGRGSRHPLGNLAGHRGSNAAHDPAPDGFLEPVLVRMESCCLRRPALGAQRRMNTVAAAVEQRTSDDGEPTAPDLSRASAATSAVRHHAALRTLPSFGTDDPCSPTGVLVSPRRSTRRASRPACRSPARAHPATIDTEVQPAGRRTEVAP